MFTMCTWCLGWRTAACSASVYGLGESVQNCSTIWSSWLTTGLLNEDTGGFQFNFIWNWCLHTQQQVGETNYVRHCKVGNKKETVLLQRYDIVDSLKPAKCLLLALVISVSINMSSMVILYFSFQCNGDSSAVNHRQYNIKWGWYIHLWLILQCGLLEKLHQMMGIKV